MFSPMGNRASVTKLLSNHEDTLAIGNAVGIVYGVSDDDDAKVVFKVDTRNNNSDTNYRNVSITYLLWNNTTLYTGTSTGDVYATKRVLTFF